MGSRGIMIEFNLNAFRVVESWQGLFSLSIRVIKVRDQWDQVIMTIYGPNKRRPRQNFWDEILFIGNK